MTITQKEINDVMWSEPTLKKAEIKTSQNTKTVIYDFGSDMDDCRYLVEHWKDNGFGWHKKGGVEWVDEKTLEGILS